MSINERPPTCRNAACGDHRLTTIKLPDGGTTEKNTISRVSDIGALLGKSVEAEK